MNYNNMDNNKVYLKGEIVSAPVYDHTVMDEQFYSFNLMIPRLSGQSDTIPVIISQRLISDNNLSVGDHIALRGQFRSHNKLEDGRSKLILNVFARELCEWEEETNPNLVELSGYICKAPIYRTTPFMREITDVLLAVNRNYDKSDYIPCIAWGRNAEAVAKMPVGTRLNISGRIQSREYHKKLENVEITKVAYEVSVSSIQDSEQDNSL